MMDVAYVLQNEVDRHQCNECLGMWLRFDHQGKLGIYRVSVVEPAACSTCKPLDSKIEKDPSFILSSERWFEQ